MRVKKMKKNLGGLNVKRNVRFKMREGEVIGLIGKNGEGKKKLLKMIYGFIEKDEGKVKMCGEEGKLNDKKKKEDFEEMGIGRKLKIVKKFEEMKVEEKIMVGDLYRKKNEKDESEEEREKEWRMGIGKLIGEEERGMNIGGLKRLEVERVMEMEKRIMMIDEVMEGIKKNDVRRDIEMMM